MSEPMSVRVEVWPIAADDTGLWLLSGGDAWRPGLPVMADGEPHAEVELVLADRDVLDDVTLIHSTSWRVDGPHVLLTYVAVVQYSGLVRERWSHALPIGLELANAVGQPPTVSATNAPAPRYIDVLLHSLRHLRFLIDTDATSRDAMGTAVQSHIQQLSPALASMYDRKHRTAA